MTFMEHNEDNIETQISILPSLLKVIAMFKMHLWYDDKILEENMVDNIGIRCRYGENKMVYL